MKEPDIPTNARRLIDDARAAGHFVEVDDYPEMVTVRVTDGPDQYTAGWWKVNGRWRFRSGSDGWDGSMTLRTIRSYVT